MKIQTRQFKEWYSRLRKIQESKVKIRFRIIKIIKMRGKQKIRVSMNLFQFKRE